ncbi:TetR family transcriptional regulator [Nocardia sp. NPDC004722]
MNLRRTIALRQDRAHRTRALIIGSAAVEFGRSGYSAASLKLIVAGSTVSKGAMYFHFDSKDDLAQGVLEAAGERHLATVVRWIARTDLTPLDILHAIVDEMAMRLEHDIVVQAEFRLVAEPALTREIPSAAAQTLLEKLRWLAEQSIAHNQLLPNTDPDSYVQMVLAALAGQRYIAEQFGIEMPLRTRFAEAFDAITKSLATPDWLDQFHRTGWQAQAHLADLDIHPIPPDFTDRTGPNHPIE